jgi:NAD(P)-dependent dehydrogenase (short-subunit alcohol dehydrogenase family)
MNRNWNLEGRTVLITGATGGIGLAAAEALAGEGAELVLLGRSAERGAAALARLRAAVPAVRAEFLQADLASLAEVRRAATAFLAAGRPLHVLVNNAGIMNTARRLTVDGHEEMFAVNHLAHYLLTRLLLPRLTGTGRARIVHVASNAHAFCRGIAFDDLTLSRRFSAFPAYGHSKLANLLFSDELSRRLRGTGVCSNALHPGAVATGIGSNNWGTFGRVVPKLLSPFFRSPERGAETVLHLARATELEGITGKYFHDLRPIEPRPWALDRAAAGRLWSVSERLVAEYL